ncbi:hypothetical protein KGF56_004444 [Candida oxycetoniae]|uniref:NADH dehydrogenase [ubiquinone] 1 alpha subcomplex subunit 13 n=1 Tax=Candida oxycetoniae TaxID=497107 RepID=A0AAI9WW25_9ASCO|nr:uncharacterized protein KGF56_004444 [Candida oxycetoniae]KAI3402770.1 hypothetical protein KGF56_004444 [Candida oxycetoniae]
MQDLPPIGGYEPIQWKRNLPSRGFRGSIYFWGIFGIVSFGFYKYYQGVNEQRELTREKKWARFYLEPLLLAEDDRNIARRYFAEKERQKLIKESVSDAKVKEEIEGDIYNDKSKTRFPRFVAGLGPRDT